MAQWSWPAARSSRLTRSWAAAATRWHSTLWMAAPSLALTGRCASQRPRWSLAPACPGDCAPHASEPRCTCTHQRPAAAPLLQVGSIFGVWPGRGFIGRRAREQVAAAYAVYGPKTVLVLARPATAGGAEPTAGQRQQLIVQEFVLQPSGAWQLSRWGAWAVFTLEGGAACMLAWTQPDRLLRPLESGRLPDPTPPVVPIAGRTSTSLSPKRCLHPPTCGHKRTMQAGWVFGPGLGRPALPTHAATTGPGCRCLAPGRPPPAPPRPLPPPPQPPAPAPSRTGSAHSINPRPAVQHTASWCCTGWPSGTRCGTGDPVPVIHPGLPQADARAMSGAA